MKKDNFLVPIRLAICCYESDQLKTCLSLYKNNVCINRVHQYLPLEDKKDTSFLYFYSSSLSV